MKKLILLFTIITLSFPVIAQLSYSSDTATVTMEPGVAHKAIITISNNSGHDINIRWSLISSTLKDYDPNANFWYLQFCECNNCYSNDFSTLPAQGVCNSPMSNGVSQDWYLTVDPKNGPLESGEWIIEVQNVTDGMVDTLVYLVMAPNSINDLDISAQVSSYPNPADEELIVNYSLQKFDKPVLNIYNIVGSLVMSVPVTSIQGTMMVNLRPLQNGIYFYTIEDNGNRLYIDKITVSH